MAWARIDDGFHAHQKTLGASLEALGLYVVALSWASSQETDGLIPAHVATLLARGDTTLCARLVASVLWEVEGECYRIHDYLKYNPSHKFLVKKRKAAVKATEKWRKGKRLLSDQPSINGPSRNTGRDGTGVLVLSPEGNKESVRGKRERRSPEVPWPEDFTLTDARRAFALKYVSDPVWEWNKFHTRALRDDVRYANWDRGWEYWCRNALEIENKRRGRA